MTIKEKALKQTKIHFVAINLPRCANDTVKQKAGVTQLDTICLLIKCIVFADSCRKCNEWIIRA